MKGRERPCLQGLSAGSLARERRTEYFFLSCPACGRVVALWVAYLTLGLGLTPLTLIVGQELNTVELFFLNRVSLL